MSGEKIYSYAPLLFVKNSVWAFWVSPKMNERQFERVCSQSSFGSIFSEFYFYEKIILIYSYNTPEK